MGIEFTPNGEKKMKIGDGVKTWQQLDYFANDYIKPDIFNNHVNNTTNAHGINNIESRLINITSNIDGIWEVLNNQEEVDLSGYYTKEEVDNLTPNIDLSVFYNKDEVNNLINEIPYINISDYYNKAEVENLLNNIHIEPVDLTGYYDKTEIDDFTIKNNVDTQQNIVGDLSMENNRIINVANPINDNDVVNKSYVDSIPYSVEYSQWYDNWVEFPFTQDMINNYFKPGAAMYVKFNKNPNSKLVLIKFNFETKVLLPPIQLNLIDEADMTKFPSSVNTSNVLNQDPNNPWNYAAYAFQIAESNPTAYKFYSFPIVYNLLLRSNVRKFQVYYAPIVGNTQIPANIETHYGLNFRFLGSFNYGYEDL